MKRVILGLGVLAGAAFLLWPKSATLPPEHTQTLQAPAPEPAPAPAAVSGTQTITIGRFALTAEDGVLMPTASVTAMFNDWLAHSQSRRYEEWKPGALAQAASLPSSAQQQLGQWLDQYVELNLALQLMSVKGEPTWDNILSNVRQLRGEYFSENDAGLFADQIALEDFTEAAVNAFADGDSPLSTLVDLGEQAATLPPEARTRAEAMLNQLSQALQQNPSLNENIEEWNRLVQADAAATLETPSVDLTEADAGFLKRYNTYAKERETLQQQGASEEQLKALRATHFSGAELMRAGTLDKALSE